MSTKTNIKKLSIAFGVLLALSALVLIRNNSKSEASRNRTFQSELCDFDSSKVSDITIYPKRKGEAIQLHRQNSDWYVTINNQQYAADQGTISNMLALLMHLRATRIAATDKSKWEKYEVTDSLALRVELKAGSKTVADLMMGKFSYQQPKNTDQNPYAQRQMGKMTSYLRLNGKKKVFATDGLLSMTFNRQADDFRNHKILATQKQQLDHIEVTLPGESYELKKEGLNWILDGQKVDSLQMESYLSGLEYLSSGKFIDKNALPNQTVTHKLILHGKALSAPVEVQVFAADTAVVGMVSSQNKGNCFNTKETNLMEKLFKTQAYFHQSIQ